MEGLCFAICSIILFANVCLGGRLRPDAFCVDGCATALGLIEFKQTAGLDYYEATCSIPVFVDSLAYCAAIYCSPSELEAGLKAYNGTCKTYSSYALDSYPKLLRQINSQALARIPKVGQDNTEIHKQPVVPDDRFFSVGLRTATAFDANINDSWTFGYACIGYWSLVLLVGITNRTIAVVKQNALRRHRASSAVHRPLALSPSISTWLRRKLILPGTFGGRVQHAFGGCCTIPPRLETVLLILYIIMNFVLCFPAYELFTGNLYYPYKNLQLSRYVADRAGILAIANLPMIWLFSARNDPFLWLTGWSFASFTRFHRWIARIATLQAIAHGTAYTVFSVIEKDLDASWKEQYWYMGAMALITMSFMLGLSVYWLRNHHYELFLILHIALAIVVLIGLWFHVKIFDGQYSGFLWTCIAVWVFDKVARITRIIYINAIPRISRSIDVVASYDAETGSIRLDVTDYFTHKQAEPGIFYYVYDPSSWRGLENHPFTLCSWEPNALDGMALCTSEASSQADREHKSAPGTIVTTTPAEIQAHRKLKHTFLIRPYSGFTHRLQNRLLAQMSETKSTSLSLLLEGPYGTRVDLRQFSDILVIAGGVGITAAVSHVNDLLRNGSHRRTIHIVWAVRQLTLVDDVLRQELQVIQTQSCITMEVYHTPDKGVTVEPQSLANTEYTVHSGRPEIKAVLEQYRRQSESSLAMVCCGPPAMADSCRSAVVQELRNAGPDVEFFNDTMLW